MEFIFYNEAMPRPREFDEAALIPQAMQAFWSFGYRGTSIEDLVSGTGASRHSLYKAYPDKRGLFIEAIKHYLNEIVDENIRRLKDVEPAGEAVRQFLLRLTDAPRSRLCRGCLLTNTAVEIGAEDKKVASLIRQAFTRVEAVLQERLEEAREAGDLAEHVEPRPYARQLIILLQGMRVMGRVGVDRKMLKEAVESALAPLNPSEVAKANRERAVPAKNKRTR